LSYANFKLQTGDVAEGKRLLEEITKQAPDYLPAWIRKAEIALIEKRYDECDELLRQALTRDNDNFDAMILHGRLLLVQNQADKAVVEFNRMTGLYDKAPQVQYQLALAYVAAGDDSKATAALNRALNLQPQYPEAMLLLGGVDISKGDAAGAVAILNQLVKLQPQDGQVFLLLGNAYYMQKNFDQALQALPYRHRPGAELLFEQLHRDRLARLERASLQRMPHLEIDAVLERLALHLGKTAAALRRCCCRRGGSRRRSVLVLFRH